MIGIVLAAGAGRRLQEHTRHLPKALLTVADDLTILDLILGNMASAGVDDVVVVTGFASHEIESRVPALERRHGIALRTLFNDRALEWNNAYSLWLARDHFAAGALMCNGDTVHTAAVERGLLATPTVGIRLAVDDRKRLAEEEMKVLVDEAGRVRRIHKGLPAAEADGEYIGVAVIGAAAGVELAACLETAWQQDHDHYYEDGFQELVDRGGDIEVMPIGDAAWVEVDDDRDLRRARELACRF